MTLDPRLPLFSRTYVEKIGEPGDEATSYTPDCPAWVVLTGLY